MTERTPVMNPIIGLLIGATLISFAPIWVKWVGTDTLGPTHLAFWRNAFGTVTLFLLVIVRGKSFVIGKKPMLFAALAGFVFFVDLFVWHRSIVLTGAGMATILGNTQVFASAILGYFIFKEKLGWKFFIAAFSGMVGVVMLVGVLSEQVEFTPRYINGVLFGLATGIAYANYLISLKAARRQTNLPDIVSFIAWVTLFSATFLGIAVLIEGGPYVPVETNDWLKLAALGVTAQALGWWIITSSLPHVPIGRAGLILLMQPTLAMVWGVLFFAEQFTLMQLIGAIVTLAAIYYGGMRK